MALCDTARRNVLRATMTEKQDTIEARNPKRDIPWVMSTYFAEGLPFMIVRILSSVFFTQLGVKERYLGYLNYLGLPWNIKFLWAPLVDGWGTKRGWQIALQGTLALLTGLIALLSYLAAGSESGSYLELIAAVFVVMAFISATNDIAIDGYYLEAIPAREDQALLSGYRVLAYRLAMVFARSGIVALAAWFMGSVAAGSPYHAWALAFSITGAVLGSIAITHLFVLPKVGSPKADVESQFARARRVFKQGFLTYLAQPKIGIILAFITLYKVGDELLFSMVTPFMLRELRITGEQYAWISGIVGAAGTVVGAMWGGWLIKRMGLRRAMWPLTVAMNLNIWLYVWLSYAKPDPSTMSGISIIAGIHGIEQIAAGLGSAALLVFLLTTCSQEYRATHYAVGSAIMSIPGTLVGGQAGRIVESIGYTNLYIIAFVAALPGMALIPFVPMKEK
jgi:MFS transporter, PAT family, beta-lactamase induction signal transducer AmpG